MAVTRVGVTLLSRWFIGDAMVTSRRVDSEDLAALPELGSQRQRDHAAGRYCKYFVSDVAFEAADDIAIGVLRRCFGRCRPWFGDTYGVCAALRVTKL